MHIKKAHLKSFRRFTDLTIQNIPASTKLVIVVGPNGSGKSCLFDAFRLWGGLNCNMGWQSDKLYYQKNDCPENAPHDLVSVEFHESMPTDSDENKKTFYFRSAYRNEPDFSISSLTKATPPLDQSRFYRMIQNDQCVKLNFERLVSSTISGVYDGNHDHMNVPQLRGHLIGEIRESMTRVFEDLSLKSVDHPLDGGSFFFQKGICSNYHYKNLSGGEKAAFDVILDLIIKREYFDNTIYCIDEPEAHLHTKLQRLMLREIVNIIPDNCQLWVSAHSVGMMREGLEIHKTNPDRVVFLDFHDRNFDEPVTIEPSPLSRPFWQKTLGVALDDLATLLSPAKVILCEGKQQGRDIPGLDAYCYQFIFQKDYPECGFISVGGESEVRADTLQLGQSIEALISGVKIIRLVDRDDKSDVEVDDLKRRDFRVLSKRHIESYLLDDEILIKLCNTVNMSDKQAELLQARKDKIEESVRVRGNPPDDIKSAAGAIYNEAKRILQLTQCGGTRDAFLRDTMAPLVTSDTGVYRELKDDIFG